MKNSIMAIVILITINNQINAQTKSNDFRNFNWRTPLSEVQKNEKSNFVNEEKGDLLKYEDQLGGSDCYVIYTFNDNNKLISGNYVFTKKYSNSQLYLHDYAKFEKLLTEKYGKAKLTKDDWSENTTPTEKENYGQAVSSGNLTLNTIWETERSIIKITLFSIENSPTLQIHYTFKTLNELEDKSELQKALIKL